MSEAYEVRIRFAEGEQETVLVTALGDDRYRLDVQPLLGLDEAIDAFYGDVIKATPEPDGSVRFRGVHARSTLQRYTGSVARDVAESPELDDLMNRIDAAGWHAERVMGGCVFAYVPEEAALDLQAEIDRVVAPLRARQARISSRLQCLMGRRQRGPDGAPIRPETQGPSR